MLHIGTSIALDLAVIFVHFSFSPFSNYTHNTLIGVCVVNTKTV